MEALHSRLSKTFVLRRLVPEEKHQHYSLTPDPARDEQAEPFLDDADHRGEKGAASPDKSKTNRPAPLFVLSLPVIITCVLASLSLGVIASLGIAHLRADAKHDKLDAHSPILRQPCGSTPAEARSRGCRFDVMSFSWLPSRCYDAELAQAFDEVHEWEWFVDGNRTQPVAHAEVMKGEYTGLFVNWEYHLRHCTAMWKKLHRALLRGGSGERGGMQAIDGYIANYAHTEHCELILLGDRAIAFETFNTRIQLKFPDCGM